MTNLTAVKASVIYINNKASYYFINEYTSSEGILRLSETEYIETYELNTPEEVLDFLEYFELSWSALEIELDRID